MQINIRYGDRRLQLKVPPYVVLPPDPDVRMRVLLHESYFSGSGTEPLPDEEVRLKILADIGVDCRATTFLRNDLAPLLDEETRQFLFSILSSLDETN